MINDLRSYDLFFKFIKTYSPVGFNGIDPADPLMIELEEYMEKNNQFFIVGDIVQMQIQYTSKRSAQLIGVEPSELTPYHFFEATHPDDIQRHGLARTKIFSLSKDLYIKEKGELFLSTSLKMRNSTGGYKNILFQCYMFFVTVPCKTVHYFQVHTDIESFKRNKNGNHYYVGNESLNFRYPDDKLLSVGVNFSDREFEIIRMIETGLNSKQIASKLFLSLHTVNTHRSNILQKAGKASIPELIYHLKESGLL